MAEGCGKQHRTMHQRRDGARVVAEFMLNLFAFNLVRIPKLIAITAPNTEFHPPAKLQCLQMTK